jgi:hypothetical protein
MPVLTANALTSPKQLMTICRWTSWVGLTAVLCWSCGTTDPECPAFGKGGGSGTDAGQEYSGGRLCAPECSVFCGTEQECSRSNGGEGGNAP